MSDRFVTVIDHLLVAERLTRMRDKTTKHPEFRRDLEALREARITTNVFTASIDERLNVNAFIVPGRGDAGDRQFGLASRLSGALVPLHCTRFARVDSVRPRRARCFCAAPSGFPGPRWATSPAATSATDAAARQGETRAAAAFTRSSTSCGPPSRAPVEVIIST